MTTPYFDNLIYLSEIIGSLAVLGATYAIIVFIQALRRAPEHDSFMFPSVGNVMGVDYMDLVGGGLAEKRGFPSDKSLMMPALFIEGEDITGKIKLDLNACYYFTVEDRFYYAVSENGRFKINKTLNELEAELDSDNFFRLKRDHIVNLNYVLSYAYIEKDEYIVRLKTPDRYEVIVARSRMQEFRDRLSNYINKHPKDHSIELEKKLNIHKKAEEAIEELLKD